MKKLTTNEFIEKSKKVHGKKYDYSKFLYINNHTKGVKIFSKLKSFGYNVKYIWELDWNNFQNNIDKTPKILSF